MNFTQPRHKTLPSRATIFSGTARPVRSEEIVSDIVILMLDVTEKGRAERMRRERSRLIMLDIMLPGEDGIEILRRLRSDTLTADIPVIMATAKGTEYDKATERIRAMINYIEKEPCKIFVLFIIFFI